MEENNDGHDRFIAEVLPALGETDAEQTTLEAMLSPSAATAVDGDEAAIVKHDARMAEVLRRVARPKEPVIVADGA